MGEVCGCVPTGTAATSLVACWPALQAGDTLEALVHRSACVMVLAGCHARSSALFAEADASCLGVAVTIH
jgi:hypothetical protein